MEKNRLMTTTETADYLRIKKITLEQWRLKGKGPQFLKIGRCVRYRMSDILGYIDKMAVSSTTQAEKLNY